MIEWILRSYFIIFLKNNNLNNKFILKKILIEKGLKLFYIKSDIIDIYNTYYLENYKLIK